MKHLAAALIATTLAGPALAGGLAQPVVEPAVAPPVAPVEPVQVDGDWGGFYAGGQLGFAGVAANGNNGDGAVAGVQAGYRWDLGRTVLGVEGDVSAANTDLTTPGDKLNNIARLKLQAGYDMGRTLVYATAGAARASGTLGGIDGSDTGWFAGLGADYALNDRWTLGGEILSNRFDNFDNTGVNLETTKATIRAGFRF